MHREALEGVVNAARDQGLPVNYLGGWTFNSEYRKYPKVVNFFKEAATVAIAQDVIANNGFSVSAGIVKFKVDRFLESIGFLPLLKDGKELPAFVCPALLGEDVRYFTATPDQISEHARALIKKHKALWDNRLVMGPVSAKGAKRAA